MKRTIANGRVVIAAGEVGEYTVCPESWRLRMVAKVSRERSKERVEGLKLHQEWAKNYDESQHLIRQVRLLLLSFVLAGLIYAFLRLGGLG